jgi:hypothetical protein
MAKHRFWLALLVCGLLFGGGPLARQTNAATQTFTVANTNDDGPGSLRAAITAANAAPAADTKLINFSIPDGSEIVPISQLPELTGGNITIDGTKGDTRPVPTPKIVINGETVTANNVASAYGIVSRSANNVIRGLVLNNFNSFRTSAVILAQGATNNTVQFNYFGTNLAGTASLPNGYGVAIVQGASNNLIANNLISGGISGNILVAASVPPYSFIAANTPSQTGNRIQFNLIGTNVAGNGILSNRAQVGISISNNSVDTTIGPGNIIGGNGSLTITDDDRRGGIRVEGLITGSGVPQPPQIPKNTRIIGNFIGTNQAGDTTIANGNSGISFSSSEGTIVGGPAAADRNVIAGNAGPGIIVRDANNDSPTPTIINATISNNIIGLNPTGTAALANTNGGILVYRLAANLTIGPSNIISGNRGVGVNIDGSGFDTLPRPVTEIQVINNLIGTSANAAAVLSNGTQGIRVANLATAVQIEGNRIVGNGLGGISIVSPISQTPPDGVTIVNNLLGLLTTTAPGNGDNAAPGIQITHGTNLTLGPGNVVVGHSQAGITISNVNNVKILETTVIGNRAAGIVLSGTNNAVIENSRVFGNRGTGIQINSGTSAPANNNRITRTTTAGNDAAQGGGIVLAGVPPANQGGPVRVATAALNNLTLELTVSGCTSGTCQVEVFGSNQSLTNEGPIFLGSGSVSGTTPLSLTLERCVANIIFTASDAAGNTSPFHLPTANASGCPSINRFPLAAN